MKKTNNQGFSLVELIIVIAIMAILVGVLAPQFIKYVEKTRAQKDASAIEEVRNATEVALSEEAVYNEITGATMPYTITLTDRSVVYSGAHDYLEPALTDSIKLPIDFTSKKYTTGTISKNVITISVSGNGYSVTVN